MVFIKDQSFSLYQHADWKSWFEFHCSTCCPLIPFSPVAPVTAAMGSAMFQVQRREPGALCSLGGEQNEDVCSLHLLECGSTCRNACNCFPAHGTARQEPVGGEQRWGPWQLGASSAKNINLCLTVSLKALPWRVEKPPTGPTAMPLHSAQSQCFFQG